MTRRIRNHQELDLLASELWTQVSEAVLSRAIVLALCGPLGAGKTTFTKALAAQMGFGEDVTSPTFTLHVPYLSASGIHMDHLDVWRIEHWSEIERLGLAEMLQPKHVIVVEWADLFSKNITALHSPDVAVVWVTFAFGDQDTERIVTIDGI